MKRALIVTPFKNKVGGVEKINEHLQKFLTHKNYQVEYLTTESDNDLKWYDSIGIKLFGLPFLTAKKFRQNNAYRGYNLIICNGEFGLGIKHENCVVLFHGSYLGFRESLSSKLNLKNHLTLIWYSLLQKIATRGKRVYAVSYFLRNILNKQGIMNVDVIPLFVDLEKFSPSENNKNKDYIFVGRFDYWGKGFDVLEKLSQNDFRIDCYTDRKKPLGLLQLLPMVRNEELSKIYQQYKILIFPSRFESFGLVPAEALASGLPILMNNVGIGFDLERKIPEFIVRDFENISEVKKQIEVILSNYSFYSDRARKYAEENFSRSAFERKWQEIVE